MRSVRALLCVALAVALVPSRGGALLGEPEEIGDLRESTNLITRAEQNHLKGLVWRAVSHLNAESDAPFFWTLDRVVSARKQLVAGLNYAFNVLVARSDCLKKDKFTISENGCNVPDNAPRELCTLDVYVDAEDASEQHFVRDCRQYDESQSIEEKVVLADRDRKMMKIMEKTRRIATQRPVDIPIWSLFSTFVGRYEKTYESKSEVLRRFNIYKRNLRRVQMMQENELGTAVYGETQFMDLTTDEFEQIYLPYKWEQPAYDINQLDPESSAFDVIDALPTSVDWRKNGVVTDVKNQESCGSCWAFSVTGNIEGQWAIKNKKLIPLSEQELLDCDIVDQACNGGLPLNAYKEIIRIGGLEPESIYPYDARKENCHLKRSEFAAYINDSVQLPQDEGKMAVWLFKNGPISIGVNAYPLQFYRHGISHPWKIFCSPTMLNHGVLIVGYGTEGKKPFWIIKNSWGSSWGESGYYRLYRGKNVCGVNEMATSAIIL